MSNDDILARIYRVGYPPSTSLDRYRKAELQKIAETWLSLVKSRVEDTEYVLTQDLTTKDLITIIRRLDGAESKL